MNIFSFIKEHVSILEIIGHYTTLKKAGSYWKGPCPFHNERTGSFTVSPHREMFYCFGCHVGGDLINFITKAENCSPIEAAKFLADRHNITLPENLIKEIPQQKSAKERYYETHKAVALWMTKQLEHDHEALTYIHKRGISPQVCSTYMLGWMPSGVRGTRMLIEAMSKESILLEDLIEAGIVIQGKNMLYSPYEERITFPIKDTVGRFCGLAGRVYKPQDQRPKYYNSKEHECFTKGSLLYGLSEAKKAIQERGYAFMVEGYMDCIAMHQYGYHNTIATMGTACTVNHLKLLSRYAHELYVLYDGDNAGQQAIIKLTELCWMVSLNLKIITLPTGQDPDSYLHAGNNFDTAIKNAPDIFNFFIATIGKDFDQKTVHEKVSLSKQLLTLIKTVQDPFTKDLLLQQASKTLSIPFETLKHELRRTKLPLSHETSLNQSVEQAPATATSHLLGALEKKVFSAIINNIALLREQYHTLVFNYIPEPYQTILKRRYNGYRMGNFIDLGSFFATLTSQEQSLIGNAILEDSAYNDESFEQLMIQLYRRQWKTMVKEIMREINEARSAGNERKVQELLQTFVILKQKVVSHIHSPTERSDT